MVVREFDTYLSVAVSYAVPLAHDTNIIRFGFNASHHWCGILLAQSVYQRFVQQRKDQNIFRCVPILAGAIKLNNIIWEEKE